MKIGDKVKALRKQNRMSLRALAEATGLSKTTLGDLESGNKNPSLETVEKIAGAFGLSVAELLQETTDPNDLIDSARNSGSELLVGLSKSGDLLNALYRAKDAPKEKMDEMARFLDALMSTQEPRDGNY